MKLTCVQEGILLAPNNMISNRIINIGDVVDYLGHLPGGNVGIRMADGLEYVAHPGCFKELRA